MTGIKVWFLEKNQCRGFYGKELTTVRETAKAVLVRANIDGRNFEQWVPKSCLTEGWEKITSNFGYHDYLVDVITKAYEDGRIENKTFKSGRNIYDQTSFLHQNTTKSLILIAEKYNINYMNREEWNNR